MNMRVSRTACGAVALALLALTGCTEDPLFPQQSMTITAVDVPPLVGPAVYELWLSYPPELAREKGYGIEHDEPEYFSAGRFTVGADGSLRSLDGSAPAAFAIPSGYNPSLIGEAVVSIEPLNDNDTVPDALFLASVVTGDAERGTATLVATSPRTFDSTALNAVQGSFVLDAPTSLLSEDQYSGLWFVRHNAPGAPVASSTSLRSLPLSHDNDRWTYEAWLVAHDGARQTYRSLGRFRNPATADSTGPGPEAGPERERAYAFPGEDFVTSQRRLNDSVYGVIISLQPEDIALAAPVLRVLERASIGVDAIPRRDVHMTVSTMKPTIEISFVR